MSHSLLIGATSGMGRPLAKAWASAGMASPHSTTAPVSAAALCGEMPGVLAAVFARPVVSVSKERLYELMSSSPAPR